MAAPRRALRSPATLLALCGLLVLTSAACGNRNPHADVVAAAGGQAVAGSGPAGSTGTTQTGPGAASPGALATSGPGAHANGATAVTGPGAAKAHGSGATGPGATASDGQGDATPVMICQLGHFSGLGGPTQGNAQPGLTSWVQWTNRHGGLAGHPIQLDSKDDQMDPNRAQQIVHNCVENEHAVAVVAAFVPATVDSIASYLEQHKIPVVGGDGVTSTWFNNPDFFPEGSSQAGTGDGQAQIMINAHKKAAGIIYCTENVACTQGRDYFSRAAKRKGVDIKGTYQVSMANPSFTSQCSSMQRAGIDAVYVALDGPSTQRLARDCNAIGYHPLYVSGGLAIDADAAASDPNLDGLTITTSVFPWMTATTPSARAFQEAMATFAPNVTPTESAAKAWVAGELLKKAINNVGAEATSGPITSAMILDGLHMVKNDDLGGLVMGSLTFPAGKPAVLNNCWGYAALRDGKWVAPQSARGTCE